MDEYIKREDAMKALDEYRLSHTMSMHGDMELLMEFRDGVVGAMNALAFVPTADVVPKSEVAEMLRLMFDDDCACNYNGNDEWLPSKCKYAETDCPMPKERLGCWKEFVEHGLAELKKKYTEDKT